MELYAEILARVLERQEIHIVFPNLNTDMTKIIASECYRALKKIKSIIDDDKLDDKECFVKIEEIINAFDELGSGSFRHDFG